MGSLMVRKKSNMALVKTIGGGLVLCWVGLHVLPVVVGAGVMVGLLGLALTSLLVSAVTWTLSIALYVGVPVFLVAFALSMFSKDD